MSGCARLSKYRRQIELGNIDRLSHALTHRVLVAVGFELMVREALDSSIEAPRVSPRFAPFETITDADIDRLFQ